MFPTSQQPPDRPPTPRYGRNMELDSDSESSSESDSGSDQDDSTPRASRAASQEPPDTAQASQGAASRSQPSPTAASQTFGGLLTHVDPILFPASAHPGSSSSEPDQEAPAGSADPAYAYSSSPQSVHAYDDVSILNRRQLVARVHSLRRELQQAIIENHELEERRQKVLEENSKLATRLAELQQRRDDQRTKAIDGDFWPPTAPYSSTHQQQ